MGSFFLIISLYWWREPTAEGSCHQLMTIFKDVTKIQKCCQSSTPIFFVCAKTPKLKVGNYSNFTITFPTIWRCAGDFFKVSLKFKMAATNKLHIFCGHKNWKIEISNNSHCTITLPTIWKCACDFTEIWNGHQKSTFWIFVIVKSLTWYTFHNSNTPYRD